jgi:hypothetical protein
MASNVKATKQYKALFAALQSEELALAAYAKINTPVEVVVAEPTPTEILLNAGFTAEQVATALEAPVEAVVVEVAVETAAEKQDRLVASKGYQYSKGRVYLSKSTLEAAARTLKSGRSQIVSTSGVGRTKALLLSKTETGDVSVQNLAALA